MIAPFLFIGQCVTFGYFFILFLIFPLITKIEYLIYFSKVYNFNNKVSNTLYPRTVRYCYDVVTADMVKEGAIVIDVGIHRVEDSSRKSGFRLLGDVKFDEVAAKASAITPVPGGVGPMTIASLLGNTLLAVEK